MKGVETCEFCRGCGYVLIEIHPVGVDEPVHGKRYLNVACRAEKNKPVVLMIDTTPYLPPSTMTDEERRRWDNFKPGDMK